MVFACSYDYSGYGASTGKVRHKKIFFASIFCKLYILFSSSKLDWNTQKRKIWKCNMLVYYPQPSEFNTYYDIEAVYNCLKTQYGTRQEEVILYGQSVGSGPTLHLASRLQRLRAVILHSAILSGIRVLYPVKMTFWFDIYKVSYRLFIPVS